MVPIHSNDKTLQRLHAWTTPPRAITTMRLTASAQRAMVGPYSHHHAMPPPAAITTMHQLRHACPAQRAQTRHPYDSRHPSRRKHFNANTRGHGRLASPPFLSCAMHAQPSAGRIGGRATWSLLSTMPYHPALLSKIHFTGRRPPANQHPARSRATHHSRRQGVASGGPGIKSTALRVCCQPIAATPAAIPPAAATAAAAAPGCGAPAAASSALVAMANSCGGRARCSMSTVKGSSHAHQSVAFCPLPRDAFSYCTLLSVP